MYHLFFTTKLAIVAAIVARRGRGSSAAMQGDLEPQLLQWLHADPYWADIITNATFLMDHAPPLISEGRHLD